MTKSAKISAALLTGGVLVVAGTVIVPKLNNKQTKNQIQNQTHTEVQKVVMESSPKEKVEDFLKGKFYSFNGVIESHRRYYNFHAQVLEPLIGPRPQGQNNEQSRKYMELETVIKNYQFKNKDFSIDYGTKIKGFRQEEIDKLRNAILIYMIRLPESERNNLDFKTKKYLTLSMKKIEKCRLKKDQECLKDVNLVITAKFSRHPISLENIKSILESIDK